MLHVVDVASYQWQLIKKNSPLITGADCVMVKISEGVSYRNPYAFDTLKGAQDRGQGVGLYHFCNAHKNKADQEAYHFLNTIFSLEQKIKPPYVLALDYEAESFTNPDMDIWARTFLDIVYLGTGIRPLLYVQGDMVNRFQSAAMGNYGLWLAWWDTMKPPTPAPWGFWAMWQYHVIKTKYYGLDLNLFNGDRAQWDKYGGA